MPSPYHRQLSHNNNQHHTLPLHHLLRSMSLAPYLDQVRLQIFNNHTIQPFSFPNNQPTAVIHNLGLVLSGYDFSSMVNI